MRERFCSVIVLGPGAPHPLKVHLSRRAMAILVIAFLLAFFAVVLLDKTYPPNVSELTRSQLEAENRALRLEAANAVIGIQKLDEKVSALESASERINDLMAE